MTTTPLYPNLITYDRNTIDLHSASTTRTPTFTFPPPDPTDSPILILNSPNPFATCLHLKSWLLQQHEDPAYSAPGILRMDHLELEKIDREREGWVVVAPGVARMHAREWTDRGEGDGDGDGGTGGEGGQLTVSVLAVLVKGDTRVRWLYTPLPITGLLEQLDTQGLVKLKTLLDPGKSSYKHKRMHTFLRETFATAIRMPDAQDFLAAQQISDFCPSIVDPEHAVSRLEEESWLYWNTPKPGELLFPSSASVKEQDEKPQGKERAVAKKDEKSISSLSSIEPSDDRYAHDLHPAEREVASLARLKCAEYLFIKRNFFRAFWEEVYRSDKMGDATAPAGGSAPASTGNPGAGRRVDALHQMGADAASPGTSTGRQDTPFSAASTPAPPSTREGDTPAPATGRGRGARNDKSKRNRVRTERAHQLWLESEYKCRVTQARTLVIGWRVLGFLDEERFLGWIREGWGGDSDGEDDGDEEGG